MWKASSNIFHYIVLIALIVTGFGTMAHLAFGHSDKDFSNLLWSLMAVFEIFCGAFDYASMKAADKFLAPIFFTAIMCVVVFILLNIFISILEDAYTRVKKKQ